MKTVFDAVRSLNSLHCKIEMLQEMGDDDSVIMRDIDRNEIIGLLEEYQEFIYEMKITK